MNRAKHPLAKKQFKAVQKAVRLAQSPQSQSPLSKSDQLNAFLKKNPKSLDQKQAKAVASIHKKMKVKKLKRTHKVSKRTNPGVESTAAPQSVHTESERWMKTVVKQNVNNGKRLSRRLSKS